MSKDDVATFFTRQTMVDVIVLVLTADTISPHKLHCKVISLPIPASCHNPNSDLNSNPDLDDLEGRPLPVDHIWAWVTNSLICKRF